MSFVHLHVHSEYSWFDGACTIDKLVKRAGQLNMPAVAITDRNSIAGAVHLCLQCKKIGLKPIIGIEIDVLNDIGDNRIFPLILLVQNKKGFFNLSRLINLSRQQDSSAPNITKTQLSEYSAGLICLSFGVVGELCTLLLEDDTEQALEIIAWYKSVFDDRYFLEIQNHGLPNEALAMNRLLNLAYVSKTQAVLTNDCHYLHHHDSDAIDVLHCLRKDIDLRSPHAKRFVCNEYYLKSTQEMKGLYDFPAQLITNTNRIADLIEFDLLRDLPVMTRQPESPYAVYDFIRGLPNTLKVTSTRANQIDLQLIQGDVVAAIKALQDVLIGYSVVPVSLYLNWTPQRIFPKILQVYGVDETKINDLCEMIPYGSQNIRQAILGSTDFSCFALEDHVYSEALSAAEKLMSTHWQIARMPTVLVCIPEHLPLPIVHNVCAFDRSSLKTMGYQLIAINLDKNQL